MFFFTSSPISRFSAVTVRVYTPGMFDEICLTKGNDKLEVHFLDIKQKYDFKYLPVGRPSGMRSSANSRGKITIHSEKF